MFQYDDPQHLNGKWLDRAKKVGNAAGHAAAAAGRGVATVGHGLLNPRDSLKNTKQYAATKITNGQKRIQEWRNGTGNEIDICECSRRVQGHLAIQYPEFH